VLPFLSFFFSFSFFSVDVNTYVSIEVANQKYRTRTVSRDVNPRWLEDFVFDLPQSVDFVLVLRVFNQTTSTYRGDTLLGIITLSLSDVKNLSGKGESWFNLRSSGNSDSSIKLQIEYKVPF